jgi:hypothetical protein
MTRTRACIWASPRSPAIARASLTDALALIGRPETAAKIPDSPTGFLESWRG